MNRAGLRERETMLLKEMNETARIKIETPSGITEEIEVNRIVKQGTVYGPQMCCASTIQVNTIEEVPVTMIRSRTKTGVMVYVDDIGGIGSKETIEAIRRNLKKMEERKKFTFNMKKSNYLIIQTGKRKIGKESQKLSWREVKWRKWRNINT